MEDVPGLMVRDELPRIDQCPDDVRQRFCSILAAGYVLQGKLAFVSIGETG
jgi:hypothetical protein